MWRIIRGPYEHGLLVVPFVWTGYLPILLFRHIGGRMIFAVRLNVSLLYHRNVTPFDAIVARMAMEIIGNYRAAAIAFCLFYLRARWTGHETADVVPRLLYMTWWCVAVGFVIAAFSERTAIFEKMWEPVSYMYLAVSGFPYMAAWLPPIGAADHADGDAVAAVL